MYLCEGVKASAWAGHCLRPSLESAWHCAPALAILCSARLQIIEERQAEPAAILTNARRIAGGPCRDCVHVLLVSAAGAVACTKQKPPHGDRWTVQYAVVLSLVRPHDATLSCPSVVGA